MDYVAVAAEVERLMESDDKLIDEIGAAYYAQMDNYYGSLQNKLLAQVHNWSERFPQLSSRLWSLMYASNDLDEHACIVDLRTSYDDIVRIREKRHELHCSIRLELMSDKGGATLPDSEVELLIENHCELEDDEYVQLRDIVVQGDVVFAWRRVVSLYLAQQRPDDALRIAQLVQDRLRTIYREITT